MLDCHYAMQQLRIHFRLVLFGSHDIGAQTTAGQDLKHAFQSCPAVNAVHWTHALKRHRAELRARQAQRERAMYEEAPNAYVAAYGVPIQQ